MFVAIKALGIDDISFLFLLFYIDARVHDIETGRLYEASIPQSQIPTLDNLLDFVTQRCKILENIETHIEETEINGNNRSKKRKGGLFDKSLFTKISQANESKCLYCKQDHPIYRCLSFKQKSSAVRRKFVSNNNVCFICLK